MPPGPAPRPMHGPLHPAAASAPGSTRGPTRGAPAGDGAGGGPQGRAGTRTAPWGLRCRGAHLWGTHLWGMSSTLTRPHTPTTKLSTSHSLTPRAMRKCPSSPHALPHELAAVQYFWTWPSGSCSSPHPVIFTECVPCCWCFGPFPSATAVCR